MEPGAYVDTIDDSERWGAPGTIDDFALWASSAFDLQASRTVLCRRFVITTRLPPALRPFGRRRKLRRPNSSFGRNLSNESVRSTRHT